MRKPAPGEPTPCAPHVTLFASTDPSDHAEAKTICATCPFVDWCATELEKVRRAAYPEFGPEGTWAGQLVLTYSEEQKRRINERKRGYRAKKAAEKKAAYEANPDLCEDCDTPLPYNPTGGPRKRCRPCADEAELAAARIRNRRRRQRLDAAVEAARADWDQRKKTA